MRILRWWKSCEPSPRPQGGAHGTQDAASVAGLLVTTEAGVAEAPKKKEEHVHMPGGGMGGMDMM